MNMLAIGQMAKKHNISERALRLYHDVGLLIPQHIDETTGYRYYALSQSTRIDTILQMKAMGLSLKQIKIMLDDHDLSAFEALLCEQLDMVETRINEWTAIRNALQRNLASCKNFQNSPMLNRVYVEYFPKRKIFYFDIEPYDFAVKSEIGKNYWKKALYTVKSALQERKLPPSYFGAVGGIIKQEDIMQHSLLCSGAFMLTQENNLNYVQEIIPAGTYVCILDKWIAGDSCSELRGITKLLDFIETNHYKIVGNYLGEVIAESSIFDPISSNVLVKMQIPVKIKH
ncbi:MerR family transcriptional regulator [Sporomusa malonica]|uniref:DNA-binding transcriptional regulator, MerR family n=1 Tax=Sporomusa malonica TaxID=112901 RepID=A0A1W1ZCM3_9FIRM|nr:helix-turn-helix domain-containing protein [Sporomusa malonica]SMC46174.1 DNA-binding transcriptional regulator, MerR family [Sporomusa malonica]